MKGRGGQNGPPTFEQTSTFDPTGRRTSFFLKLGSRGRCLLPSTFAKVEIDVEGTTFLQSESLEIIDLSPWSDIRSLSSILVSMPTSALTGGILGGGGGACGWRVASLLFIRFLSRS